jgi:SAM-dependent methyltransferase
MSGEDYVLGTDDAERNRLGLQHRIWSDVAVTSWRRAGFGPGARVLDVGCGPGFTSLELADLVTPTGEVVAFDESAVFLEHIGHQARVRKLPQVRVCRGNAERLTESLGTDRIFDGVYMRWLLCWLSNPEACIAGAARLTKPGARLVVHDYFNWRIMGTSTRSAPLQKIVEAALASFAERGGDIDIAGKLLELLDRQGFTVRQFDVHQRVVRGGGLDATMAWVQSWWRTYTPKLVARGLLTESQMRDAFLALDQLEQDPNQFFVCPPVFEFVAERRQ